MEDQMIMELYFARDEQAIAETDKKYGSYCYQIANGILSSREDAEETVSDTFWHTWNAIPPQRPRYLKLFLTKITRNLAFTRWRKLSAAKRGGGETELVLEELAGAIPGKERIDDNLNLRELGKTIRSFLDTLSQREQDIFLLRYFYVEDPAAIAMRFGMKRANVNLILSRTRMKLKTYLSQEGYEV